MRAALSAPLVVAFATAGSACKIDLDEGVVPPLCKVSTTAPICVAAGEEMPSDFAWLQKNMFSTNCGGLNNACHSLTDPTKELAGTLDLGEGAAYATLLGKTADNPDPAPLVESQFDDNHFLVEPGFPNRSYLLFMLKGLRAADDPDHPFKKPPSEVGYMPQKNNTLCCQKLEVVERWIAAGAPP